MAKNENQRITLACAAWHRAQHAAASKRRGMRQNMARSRDALAHQHNALTASHGVALARCSVNLLSLYVAFAFAHRCWTWRLAWHQTQTARLAWRPSLAYAAFAALAQKQRTTRVRLARGDACLLAAALALLAARTRA
jgi:hypothetical protein